jgi:hypothetical protein
MYNCGRRMAKIELDLGIAYCSGERSIARSHPAVLQQRARRSVLLNWLAE